MNATKFVLFLFAIIFIQGCNINEHKLEDDITELLNRYNIDIQPISCQFEPDSTVHGYCTFKAHSRQVNKTVSNLNLEQVNPELVLHFSGERADFYSRETDADFRHTPYILGIKKSKCWLYLRSKTSSSVDIYLRHEGSSPDTEKLLHAKRKSTFRSLEIYYSDKIQSGCMRVSYYPIGS